ncbi:hypothetical protein KZZ52_18665 [Dactylosporangium sp. AC04546]|uniref:hypothetical protein n=1 Tax=Dactylosporangium sp. AC04546 TaxID=2862460 RepID=UPI001EE070F7|nr:hypothetical protein [Dactylosporangium sp. AC04546]WVK87326.1 hypothetical protein KZZ52_18665 [Dactylosporangium sp. AC04546]
MESTGSGAPDRRRLSAAARTRVKFAAIVVSCAGLVGVAAGQTSASPGLQFTQVGHWVYNSAFGSAFHVDGSTNQVDAQVRVPGGEPGSQVAQGEQSGYVVQRSRVTVFSKSTLSVEDTLTPPATEQPVVLEVAGGPYLVYRNAGQVVRLGDPAATVAAGGPLSRPAATGDGTVWLHRIDSGSLCELPKDASRLACHAQLEQGHSGALTVAGDQPVLVDTTSDTLRTVGRQGFGEPAATGVDLPASAQVATGAVADRLAVVDPERNQLLLIDTAGLHKRPVAKPIVVELPKDGRFAEPVTTSNVVAVVDETRNDLLTYDRTGAPKDRAKIPGKGGAGGSPRLARGEDNRIYADSADGSHVLVVNGENGSIGGVEINGETGSSPSVQASVQASQEPTPGATGGAPPNPGGANPGTNPGTGNNPGTGPGVTLTPAAAPAVTVKAASGAFTVTWNQPDLRGGTLVHYLVSAQGQADRQVTGQSTQYTGISGTVTVRAVTRFGSATVRGKPGSATVPAVTPPTVEIVRVRSTIGLVVTVNADTKGAPATCRVSFGSASASASCNGATDITITNVAWFGAITITATITNAGGSGTDTWTGVPQVA